MTERRVASESYLKGAALKWGFGRGKKHFFQFYDSIHFVNISSNFDLFSYSASFGRKALETYVKASILLKSQSSMLTDGTAITACWGVSGHHLGWGFTQLPLGDSHKLLDTSWDEDAPMFQLFEGKRSGCPLSLHLHSGHLGEVWRAAADLDASLHRVSVYESEWVQWIDRGYLESSLV